MKVSEMTVPQQVKVAYRSPWNVTSSENVDPNHPSANLPSGISLSAPVSGAMFVLSCLSCIYAFMRVRKAWQSQQDREAESAIRCKTCYFFSNNLQLNCAVRPSEVLTQQAIGCPDYCPKGSRRAPMRRALKK